ncbi:hypothetical protein [Enterobacter mori]|uniref:hypothetical protein n=1 Tax=Enterobacter mori TaxID=539813 RepID=UPI003B841C0E
MAIKFEVVIFTDEKGMGASAALILGSNGHTQQELDVARHLKATVDQMFSVVFKSTVSQLPVNQESKNVH